jgi:hypothetical protein
MKHTAQRTRTPHNQLTDMNNRNTGFQCYIPASPNRLERRTLAKLAKGKKTRLV